MLVTYQPIGYARTPFVDKASAPRQGTVAKGVRAIIELEPRAEFRDALRDLAEWDRVILIFHFHLANDFRPCVQPPRSEKRRGVFSTRSPHRPNPIGFTVAKLISVEGTSICVEDVDLLDGTPILDIKPYVPYADAFPEAGSGWLESPAKDPEAAYSVVFSERAEAQLVWLGDVGVDLRARLLTSLSLGPRPHAYRRIRVTPNGVTVSVKTWRADVSVREPKTMCVECIYTGFRPSELRKRPELLLHRRFSEAFSP